MTPASAYIVILNDRGQRGSGTLTTSVLGGRGIVAPGPDRYILPIPRLSEDGSLLMDQMLPSKRRPRALIDAFKAGTIPLADMPELIHFAWTYDDAPTSDIGEPAWLELFEHVGFFTYPPVYISQPASPVTLYRGTTADRTRRMSWASERDVAANAGRRHTSYGITWMYRAAVRPETLLAHLHRPDEGWTVVVNPAGLAQIERLEALPSP